MSRPKVGDLIPVGSGGYPLIENVSGFTAKSIGNNEIEINWTDPPDVVIDGTTIATWSGTMLRRKTLSYPVNEKDGELVIDSKVRSQFGTTPLVDEGVTDTQYYYMLFPYTEKKVITVDAANRATATATADDMWGTPGPLMLANGTMQEGFFGLVPSSQFITGDALASAITLSNGTSQFSTTDWIKSAGGGKILFSPMKTIRHSISWDHILAKGAVWGDGTTGGDRTVQVQGFTFKVRLFRGLNNAYDPKTVPVGYDDVHCHGSEWNRLILPLHVGAKTGSWGDYGSNVESGLPYWGTDFTDADLQVASGNGRATWCQNYAYSSAGRCYRGGYGVAGSSLYSSSDTGARGGWRPVLELVTD